MILPRRPVASALLLAGLAGCSRDPSAQTSPSASASPAPTLPTAASQQDTKSTKPSPSQPSGPAVVISLERASATRTQNGLLITCEASLFNRTGGTINVTTNFQSAFDGFEVVVTSEDGKELTRQAYIHHQSPSAEDQRIPLPPGLTTQTLRFPVDDLKEASGTLNVKLAGGLPGTALRSGLASNEVEAVILDQKGAP